MNKKVWLLTLGALVSAQFLFAPRLAAQDYDAEPPPEQEAREETVPADPGGESSAEEDSKIRQDSAQTIDDLDSFVPSVEISSDLSISYPVDI
ncbi:MAG: hypothetical protein IIA05_01255 [Proteobacteria bacterium]|nr:hypothetical protein [Pseudomonadota bacterium]